MEAMRRRMEA
jgi:hypothetical protein